MSSFYHSEKGVLDYVKMAEGYDGGKLVDLLVTHLDANASVLELGMGPGVDLDLLAEHFDVTGSDFSQLFVDRYKKLHPNAKLLQLDAISLNTEQVFNGIYSNKVLHHLEDEELGKSILRQHDILSPNGLVMHSFWYGDSTEEHAGMKFHFRNEEFLENVFSAGFETLQMTRYTEMEDDDSIFILARKK
jgi:trans-aconitate methyltransferase